MNIWIEENEAKAGPFPVEDIPAMVSVGRITDETLVWHKYLPDWTPFKETKAAILPGGSHSR